MATGTVRGTFAHVAGTFDLAETTGTIDYVTPVGSATESDDFEYGEIHLIGEDANRAKLFDKPVNPQRNSCAPHALKGTFDEFITVSSGLEHIRLTVKGVTAAEFTRGRPATGGALALGAPDPSAPHRLPLVASAGVGPASGVTYAVQARADGKFWQTLAVGLPTPTTDVDLNQFPGAKDLEIRVLRSDGFDEAEVLHETKTF